MYIHIIILGYSIQLLCSPGIQINHGSPGIVVLYCVLFLVDVYFLDDLADLRLADLRLADLFLAYQLSRFGLAVFLGVPSCSKTKDRYFIPFILRDLPPNTAPQQVRGGVVRRCNRNSAADLTS
jgi:hypothetical protein